MVFPIHIVSLIKNFNLLLRLLCVYHLTKIFTYRNIIKYVYIKK